jgi:hypothetical protein
MSFSSMMHPMGTNQMLSPGMGAQQQQIMQQDQQDLNSFQHGNNQNGPGLASFFLQGSGIPGMMNMGGINMNTNNMGGGNQAAMLALMNNHQAAAPMGGMGMNNFNLNDLKRLQQLQAQLQSNTPNNMLMNNQATPSGQEPSVAILQNYLDQKLQSSRLDDSLRNQLGMSGMVGQGKPILGSNLFQERLIMNHPNAMGGGFKAIGSDLPLPPAHSLFPRDGSRRMRGGVIEPFPERLHRLLCEVEAAGRSDVISFVAGGRAFAIHKPDKFFKVRTTSDDGSLISNFLDSALIIGFHLLGYCPSVFSPKPPKLFQEAAKSLRV